MFFMRSLILFLGIILFMELIIGANFELKDIHPNQELVSFFKGESQMLSIGEKAYDNTKWYLDGELVKNNVNTFDLNGLESEVYIIRVDVTEGNEVDSKTWNVVIKEDLLITETGLDEFEVIYYVYISVLLIVILLVVRLFIIEKKRDK